MSNTFEKGKEVIMNTYNRFPIVIEKGEGMYVYDENGKKYLDFVAGIAVNSLGHGHKKLSEAVAKQAENLIHISNLYYSKPQISLGEKLIKNSCFDKVFFCNSGAESIEGALKLSRKYANMMNYNKFEIITMVNSFHGRTYGAVSATGQEKYQKGLSPLLPGISHVPFNDFEALKNAITPKTCAILLEPIQGEGGVTPAKKEYLEKVRELCDEDNILLIYDEIQCGVGRTGYLFAYEHFGVKPDIAVFAKGLAGGVPIGALMTTQKVAEAFAPGDHASTFGGNPLATAAGNVVMDELFEGGLLENVKQQGDYLSQKLNELKAKHSVIVDVRGVGLIQGIELSQPVNEVISRLIEQGILLVNAGTNVIRFVPSLIVSKEHINKVIETLDNTLAETFS